MVKLEGFTTAISYTLENGDIQKYDMVAYGETPSSEIKYFNFEFDGCKGQNNLVFVKSEVLDEVLNFIKTISRE